MDIQTIGIIGAGTMGNGIAHTAARSGFKVILHDIAESFLDRAVSTIAKNLEREVAKGKITANDKNAALSRISAVTQNSALSEADFVRSEERRVGKGVDLGGSGSVKKQNRYMRTWW